MVEIAVDEVVVAAAAVAVVVAETEIGAALTQGL